MDNLHPEYSAASAIIVNIIIWLCKKYGIDVDSGTQTSLTVVAMYLVSRLAKRFDPPTNEALVEQLEKNITKKQGGDIPESTIVPLSYTMPADKQKP